MTDSDLVGVALIVGWGAGLVVGWWFRGFRQRWLDHRRPATNRQISYISDLTNASLASVHSRGLTVRQASALIED